MKVFNCIVIVNEHRDKVLFCKRLKPPYKGLYNLVGGKVEEDESSLDAAYRELYEETGISSEDIKLIHYMDMVYYQQDKKLEIFGGILTREVYLKRELQDLYWMSINDDFFDWTKYAGDGNIGHIIRQYIIEENVIDRKLLQ